MSEEDRKKEKKKESGEISRREFLKDAGFVVGGAAVGAAIAWPLVPKEEKIVEVPGDTVEVPKYIDPFDGTELDSYAELVAHVAAEHADVDVIEVTKFTCPYDGQEFATLAALGVHLDAVHGGRDKTPGEVVAAEGQVTLAVNGIAHELKVEPTWALSDLLRFQLGLTGTKVSCYLGGCGMCTVIMDGKPVYSCSVLAIEADGSEITTVEGLAGDNGELSPLQQAFVDNHAIECGFCTPGFIMSARALLNESPFPTEEEVRVALAGNMCKCHSVYDFAVNAVLAAAGT